MRKNKTQDSLDLDTLNPYNNKLYLEFRKLIKIYEHQYKNINDPKLKIVYKHKIISLKNSSKQIKIFPDKITKSNQLIGIQGIGKGTLSRIDNFLENNKLTEVDDFCNQNDCDTILYNKNQNLVYEDLLTIFGIGEKYAKKLIEDYKLQSVKDLQKLVKEGKVIVPDNVKIGLKYFGKVKNKIPRSEITQIREFLFDIFDKLDNNIVFQICGSFRRKNLTSNDIDLLVTSYELNNSESSDFEQKSKLIMKKITDQLYKYNFMVDSLTTEDSTTKFMGLCKFESNPIRRIDIRLVSLDSFFPALLYFTGSYEFNERMRGIAKRLGYKLNEYGLYKYVGNDLKKINIYSEKDVFDILGMKFLEPNQRI